MVRHQIKHVLVMKIVGVERPDLVLPSSDDGRQPRAAHLRLDSAQRIARVQADAIDMDM
jgi:hypothetical protein